MSPLDLAGIVLSIVLLIVLAALALWYAASAVYLHRRRASECDLDAYLRRLFARFGIGADPAAFQRAHLSVGGGVCLALYILAGRRGAPVFVFMPGTAVYAELYAQLLVDLHRRGYTVVAYDPRGHGRSGRLRGYFTIDEMIRDARTVAAFARKRFGRRVVFSGSSQGGVVSLYVAATGDPNIATVVCHNIAYLDGDTIREISVLKPPLWAVPILCRLFTLMRRWVLPVTFYLPFSRLKLPGGGSAVALLAKDPLATTAYSLGAIATLAKTEPACSLGEIRMPVMLISSSADEVFPVAYEKRIFAMLTCERHFLLVPDMPHLMIMKPPPEVIDGIVAWVDRHAG